MLAEPRELIIHGTKNNALSVILIALIIPYGRSLSSAPPIPMKQSAIHERIDFEKALVRILGTQMFMWEARCAYRIVTHFLEDTE
jgi:hypothetical protein